MRTLRETSRVLKPGSQLVAIDRAHYDGVSDEQLRFMLNVQYSAEWKRRNGYVDSPLSRAQNGEHEIRMKEWLAAFAACEPDMDPLQAILNNLPTPDAIAAVREFFDEAKEEWSKFPQVADLFLKLDAIVKASN